MFLQGNDAKDTWRRVLARYPTIERARGLTTVATYHPGRQAQWSRDPGMNGQSLWAIIGPIIVLAGVALVTIGVRTRRR